MKETFAKFTLRILQNRLYQLRTKNEEANDVLTSRKCLVGIPNPLFYSLRRLKHVLWKGRVRLMSYFAIFSILLHNQWLRIEQHSKFTLLNLWSTKKWTYGTCGWGAHPLHPPTPFPYEPVTICYPMMLLIGESLDFGFFFFFEQQFEVFEASLEQLYIFLTMVLKDNMNRLSANRLLLFLNFLRWSNKVH